MAKRLITGWYIAAGIASACYVEPADDWLDGVCWLVAATLFFSLTLREMWEPRKEKDDESSRCPGSLEQVLRQRAPFDSSSSACVRSDAYTCLRSSRYLKRMGDGGDVVISRSVTDRAKLQIDDLHGQATIVLSRPEIAWVITALQAALEPRKEKDDGTKD